MTRAVIEATNKQEGYNAPNVALTSAGRDIYVVSDLHLAAGRDNSGRYSGTENFFADGSFARFTKAIRSGNAKRILIINGDFIDFLRVVDTPNDAEIKEWQSELASIGYEKTETELKAIDDKERKFGLRTHDHKSIWKLFVVWRGHREVFAALAEWVASGSMLVITKGNHDLEWFYPQVRNYFKELLRRDGAINDTNILFIDHSLTIDKTFYIEHGHRYDKFSTVVGEPFFADTEELNIPFGSFFNRYLINTIELQYPYLDNVKPAENIVPLLIRERFPLALKIFGWQIWFLLKMVRKRYWHFMFAKSLCILAAMLIPLAAVAYILWKTDFFSMISNLALPGFVMSGLTSIGGMVVYYVLSRLTAKLGLQEPTALDEFARKHFAANPSHSIVTLGHTHHPDEFNEDGKQFFNTGTWIPIIETTSAEVSYERTFTYLHVHSTPDGLVPEHLLKWNDDAGRGEPVRLIRKK
jgi:UDP-2,3-diacylglucosamine pyrophosphatase LpxH